LDIHRKEEMDQFRKMGRRKKGKKIQISTKLLNRKKKREEGREL